ncbi:pyridoxal-dependent decarboxylase [bacterium]|nr:pyridoxal-dependent decarboxylase [bacterium]
MTPNPGFHDPYAKSKSLAASWSEDMISRRQFLTHTSAAGALVATCSPPELLADTADDSLAYLRKRSKLLEKDTKIFLGYPGNKNLPPEGYFKWRDELFKTEIGMRSGYNNVGDPYYDHSVENAHYLEAETIHAFGERFGFDRKDTWGFMSNSGTDSNMHGAYIGRTLLKQKTGLVPKIYYTKEAHYSIQIIRDLLVMEEILVETLPDGAMDPADLKVKLQENNDAPALVLATIGTTFKGAIDDIDAIQVALQGVESYVHLDAALFGGYMQASKYAKDLHATGKSGKRYDSISVSCHKFFGFPMVAGIFVTKQSTFEEYRNYFSQVHDPAYISHVPGTITCSRSSLNPALFHYFSTDESLKVQRKDAKQILVDAEYLLKEMNNHFPELDAKRASDKSNTVYFKKVSDKVKKKWILATIGGEGKVEPQAHVVVMPHATKHYLDMFLTDLEKYRHKA